MNTEIESKIKELCFKNRNIEVCGVICINNKVVEIQNIHPQPDKEFRLCPKEQAAAEIINGEIIAVWHSHINGKPPSFNDNVSSNQHELDFIVYDIINDKMYYKKPKEESDYLNRDFEIGKYDCYGLVRDYYKNELSIELKDYFRNEFWHQITPYYFDDNFKQEGFSIVHQGSITENVEIKEHDCLLFSMIPNNQGCNHVAVYLSNNKMLHHPRKAKSQISDLSEQYKRKCKYILRHHAARRSE